MSDNIYKEGQVATVGNMTITDITHKPKRMQGDNIPKEKQVTTVSGYDTSSQSDMTVISSGVTIESAIRFYEENAVGDYAILYKMTAKWLDTLRKYRAKKLEAVIKAVVEGENEES